MIDLTDYEARVCSQNGEDGVIAELCARVGVHARTFLEIGAGDGTESNCLLLAKLGWHGMFIESDPERSAALAARWEHEPRVHVVRHRIVPADFNPTTLVTRPTVLSIDVDGNDYWLWEAHTGQPWIVVIEYNGALPLDSTLVQPYSDEMWDGFDYFGASLGALEALGRRKGMTLVHTEKTGTNAFFLSDHLLDALPIWNARRRVANYPGGPATPDPQRREYLDVRA